MARKRKRDTAVAQGGHTYRSAQGQVGTVIYWSPEEREAGRKAAVMSGCRSLQEWARKLLTEASRPYLEDGKKKS